MPCGGGAWWAGQVVWAGAGGEPRRTSLKRVEKCSRILPCAFSSSASLTGGPVILGAADAASFRACATFAASRRFRSAASLASFFA